MGYRLGSKVFVALLAVVVLASVRVFQNYTQIDAAYNVLVLPFTSLDNRGYCTASDCGHEVNYIHGDGMEPAISPPGIGASQSEISAFLTALATLPESHQHGQDGSKASEHEAAMGLAERGDATHVAIGDGDWFDPNIWSNGQVPNDGARVLIPDGVSVDYGAVSDVRLFTVRVDGNLEFKTDVDSRMVFDTFLIDATGQLTIGTADEPVEAETSIDLVVANNGPIDTAWDPLLLSRGLISHGKVMIHGSEKDSHEKVDDDPMAGDMSLSFADVPNGWEVGDTIVVAGTKYEGHKWDNSIKAVRPYESEDEVRVITQIDSDGTVHFDQPLEFNHDTPRDDLKTSVANYTRNVSIETEGGDQAEVYERGHIMFMHSDDVDVHYLEVHELGRTDKSVASVEQSDQNNAFDTNVQGRYSLHLHRTGTGDVDEPVTIAGSSVWGSPGWGFVHHDSNAILENNASYNTFGAGYVAETGNEIGAWHDNIAIYAEGISWSSPKNASDTSGNTFDIAKGGDGFWFQGRMVESSNNIAAGVNVGFVYFHRNGDDRMIKFDSDLFEYPDALFGETEVSAGSVPILEFQGNEAFAAKEGLHVAKANPNQGNDVWSHLKDFVAWNVKSGVKLEYTSHYILENFDVIGKAATPYSKAEEGISLGNNTSEITIIDAKIDSFDVGIELKKNWVNIDASTEQHSYVIIDPSITNTNENYLDYNPSFDKIISELDLPDLAPDLTLDPITLDSSATLITGTKSDTLGEVDFPGGTDRVRIQKEEAVKMLEENGYWTTSDGKTYFLVDIYFTDRVTGEVFFETHSVDVPGNVAGDFGKPNSPYANAKYNGEQDISIHEGWAIAGTTILDTATPAIMAGDDGIASAQEAGFIDGVEVWELLTDGQPLLDLEAVGEEDTSIPEFV